MSYHKGDIEIDICGYDAREDDGYETTYRFANKQVIELPHSCDQWVIGGVEEAKAMIEDLQAAIKKLEQAPAANEQPSQTKPTPPQGT